MPSDPQVTIKIERVTDDGQPVNVVTYQADFTNFNLGETFEFTAENTLRATYAQNPDWEPGTYRISVTIDHTGKLLGSLDFPLPVPAAWAKLDYGQRRHGNRLLTRYPGTTYELIGQQLQHFSDHYNGRISTAELTELTGYTLPEGHPRPSVGAVEIGADDKAANPT